MSSLGVNTEARVYIGVMSGTSLDGISAAAVRFADKLGAAPVNGETRATLLAFRVTPYTDEQHARLRKALSAGTAQDYCRLNFDLGSWLAEAVVGVLADAGVARSEIRAIGSHGQSLWHEPLHSTWQLGEAAVIAERTGVDVVSDFRVRDVAAGGHGAPLVSMADALIFSGRRWRALQNIGGIGNVTVVPPNGSLDGVRAFDTGPGASVIDRVVRSLVPGLPYDVDGRLAAAGTPIDEVVNELLAAPYFASPPPKSTGPELFDARYVQTLIERARAVRPSARPEDIIATATSLTASSIADAYRRFLPEPIAEVLVSGGGARNPTLVDMLTRLVAPVHVRPFADEFFDGEAKEAVAFALLAYLHLARRMGNVPRATGAKGGRILGKLTPA
jgi:anhydro-N-acetylmuramic acid kinase